MKHVFIIGAKGLGNYGGFETFVEKLIEYHKDNHEIYYHVACKANGQGSMDNNMIKNAEITDPSHFLYNGADCYLVKVPEKLGSAQAVFYDLNALEEAITFCDKHSIERPIFYILACRIGPFIGRYKKQVKKMGGLLVVNPDGHEWKRGKWPLPVKLYWRFSERLMVKNADMLVCDSINIEKYIQEKYEKYDPETYYIAYGADPAESALSDADPEFKEWLERNDTEPFGYYLVVGRMVPENNFGIILREFMSTSTDRKLIFITTSNRSFKKKLEIRYRFSRDKRIRFADAEYDAELLKKIRENAFAYIHGHEVGGTNPSLLEALASTRLNLVYEAVYNREVADRAALYWSKAEGSLSGVMGKAEGLNEEQREGYSVSAKARLRRGYTWDYIADKYEMLFKQI